MKKKLPPVSTQVTGARYYVAGRVASSRKEEAVVHLAGREECLPDYRVERKTYPTYAVELVISGKGRAILHGKEHLLRPGMVFAYGPGIPHGIHAEGSGLVKYFVDCSGAMSERLLRAGLKPGRSADARYPDQMASLFELILARGGERSPADPSLCSDYLRALLRMAGETFPGGRESEGAEETARRAMMLISSRGVSFRSVADLAGRLGVSPEHLARSFRKAGMESPSALLTARRMNHAAGLLLSGGRNVKQAAYELGFTSPFHFSSVFRKHFGFPPSSLKSRIG